MIFCQFHSTLNLLQI